MVRVIQLADDGTEMAAVDIDDFTMEVVYSGIAEMLRAAAAPLEQPTAPLSGLPREARQRRQRILSRVRP